MKSTLLIVAIIVALCALATMSSASQSKDWKAEVKSIIASHDVVMFSKSYCPYCKRAKHALTTANINFHVVELDQVAGGPQMQDALQTISGQRTIPNVFIKGHHVGGSDKVMAGLADGRINELMQSTSHKEL